MCVAGSGFWVFLVFGLLCRHTASNSMSSETHTSGARMRVRSTASICALVTLEIAKVFGCEAEDTGLPYAEENIGAGLDAFIRSWGVISQTVGDSSHSLMCCIDFAADVFHGC